MISFRTALASICFLCSAAALADPPDSQPDIAQILLERGEQALGAGNISGARRLLQQPADQGNGEALRFLAESYDPVWLAQHNVIGIDTFADLQKAAELYQQAAKDGDQIAQSRFNH